MPNDISPQHKLGHSFIFFHTRSNFASTFYLISFRIKPFRAYKGNVWICLYTRDGVEEQLICSSIYSESWQ